MRMNGPSLVSRITWWALSAGDERSVDFVYPEDAVSERLRGKHAQFTMTFENVKARGLPELDDEFATSLGGEYENLEAVRAAIREALEKQARESYNETYDSVILEQALEQAEFKYPPQMLEHEMIALSTTWNTV